MTRASIDNAEKVEAYIDYDEIIYDIGFVFGQPVMLLSLLICRRISITIYSSIVSS